MEYLILGAGGQLGSEWCDFLRSRGISHQALTSADLSVTDPAELVHFLELVKPRWVVNCAAYTKVDLAEEEPEKAYAVNSMAVGALAVACKDRGIKLIHYSTDYVFSGKEYDRVLLPNGYPENQPLEPGGVYASSKADGEARLVDSGCEYLLIRVAWLCGKYGTNFVKTMLRLGEERDELKVVADQFGSPSFAGNVVVNSHYLASLDLTGTWHIASDGCVSWYEYARKALELARIQTPVSPIKTSEFPTKAKRPAYSRLNITKLKDLPGSHIDSWETGLAKLIQEMRGN